jgi:hypothetical protein
MPFRTVVLLSEAGAAATRPLVPQPDLLRLVKLVAASEDAFGGGRVTTGAGLQPCAEGGRRLPSTVPVMSALQVRAHGQPLRLPARPCEVVPGEYEDAAMCFAWG